MKLVQEELKCYIFKEDKVVLITFEIGIIFLYFIDAHLSLHHKKGCLEENALAIRLPSVGTFSCCVIYFNCFFSGVE